MSRLCCIASSMQSGNDMSRTAGIALVCANDGPDRQKQDCDYAETFHGCAILRLPAAFIKLKTSCGAPGNHLVNSP